MKKNKIIVISMSSILIILIATIGYYFYHQSVIKKQEEAKKAAELAAMPKPSSYCFMTYKISTDNGKTWDKKIINDGQKVTYQAECWKKYLEIMKDFKSETAKDGNWIGKTKDGKMISSPSLQISEEPFDPNHKKPKLKPKEDPTNDYSINLQPSQ
ncbi:hypothetical protein fh0823_09200 [Francisella halioticida]|uniref:Uncharacterized protein n=1 Tax=Francisella halioticida TaxID=549298 RepID=A0ABM6LYW0_9GAMM|nr:hypothetical protein [Francisella halioticida]ASG67782.1 hypothetical protein CDV26_04715 [Francisella halioticida]BCD90781.1 hypothetical protein fh0823_09200 [Francisella halioticida]